MQLSTSWEPYDLTAGTLVVLPEGGPHAGAGVVNRMAVIGVTVSHAVEQPEPRQATAEEASLLGIQKAALVTHIRRTYYSDQGRPVETADIVVPVAHCEIVYEIPINRWRAGDRRRVGSSNARSQACLTRAPSMPDRPGNHATPEPQARPAGRDAAKPPRPTWSRSGSEACLQPSAVGPADGVRVGQRVRRLLVYTSVRFCGAPEWVSVSTARTPLPSATRPW